MKKNKMFLLPLLITGLFILISCDDKIDQNSGLTSPTKPLKAIAIEISQEKEKYQFIESIFESANSEFLQGEYVQSIPQKIRSMPTIGFEKGDTIKNAEEIPVYSIEEINQKIFTDGTYRYENLNTTPADSNIFNMLNVYSQPISEVATKTILMDGVAYLYNRNGELIKTEETAEFNYTALLDSIKKAIAAENYSGTTAQRVRVQSDIRIAKAISRAINSGMHLISQSDDEIVMELNFGLSNESSIPQHIQSGVVRKAVTRFSGDMTRILEQKIYENNQLVQVATFSYAESHKNFAWKSASAVKSFLPDTNVRAIVYKSLKVSDVGTPCILVTKENYKKNLASINL